MTTDGAPYNNVYIHAPLGAAMTRRPPMTPRTIRTSDALWAAAQKVADERGENVSEEIRKFLERYAKKGSTK